ncbi:MAG: hypothetical protein ABI723_21590 [Bacteroidia bacterium]
MSKTKQLTSLLESLEKKEFDKIVKIYLQKEYNFEKIIFTDGKNDTGLDIRVFDFEGQKIQYQLTTQKSSTNAEMASFVKKVMEDLSKAKTNLTEFRFKDKLIFFYSKTLTNKKIRELESMAFKDYSINLEIIEATRLAEESENIIEIQAELFKINELDKFQADNSSFDNTLLYDLLSFGKPTEFKIQVIDSFILQLFYKHDKLSKEEIIKACEEKFSVKENIVFYEKLLSKFQTEKKVTRDKISNDYSLTPDEKIRLKKKNEQFELDKNLFIREINEILIKYNQQDNIDDYIKELKQLYIDNFNTDLTDALNNDEEFHIFNICKDFSKFIDKKLRNKAQSKTLSKELLKYCLNNKFIQKIAASKVYSSKIDNNRLENYLSKKKKIFIDTAVGLHSLCYYYKPKNNFKDYFYKATKNLIEFANNENIKLNISERYIWEIQSHIKDAFNLIPFTSIPNFERLGSSRNVFYNFYNYLKISNSVESEKSFSEFLQEFGFKEHNSGKSFNSIIEHSLSQVNIIKQDIIRDYKIDETNRLFENALAKFYKNKSTFTRNNDSIMVEFLADKDVEIHPLQPVFITWDKTFFEVHTKYINKFPNSQNWLMLTPNKIIDVYSLLKFSINSETVTENLLALISDDIITNTHSLVDTLSFILNPEDEVGLEYTNRLAGIRESEINSVNKEEVTPPDNFEGEAVIDDIFFNLTNYYNDKVNKLDEFKMIFTKKELIDDVVKILSKAIKEFYDKKILDNTLYTDFDKLILKVNEIK